MKTKLHTPALTLILAFAALLLSSTSMARTGNDKAETGLKGVFIVTSLAPTVPAVAEFNDMPAPVTPPYAALQPVTPLEASFSDSGTEAYASLKLAESLAPASPEKAGFED